MCSVNQFKLIFSFGLFCNAKKLAPYNCAGDGSMY